MTIDQCFERLASKIDALTDDVAALREDAARHEARLSACEDQGEQNEKRINRLEQFKALVIGAALASGGAFGAAIAKIFS